MKIMAERTEPLSLAGAYLRTLRESAGLSLREPGPMIGMSYAYLQQLESGSRQLTLPKLKRLVQILGGDLEEAVRLHRIDIGV